MTNDSNNNDSASEAYICNTYGIGDLATIELSFTFLTARESRVLRELCLMAAKDRYGCCVVCNKTIAKKLKISESSIAFILKILIASRIITKPALMTYKVHFAYLKKLIDHTSEFIQI